jgi:hypothetical protein
MNAQRGDEYTLIANDIFFATPLSSSLLQTLPLLLSLLSFAASVRRVVEGNASMQLTSIAVTRSPK